MNLRERLGKIREKKDKIINRKKQIKEELIRNGFEETKGALKPGPEIKELRAVIDSVCGFDNFDSCINVKFKLISSGRGLYRHPKLMYCIDEPNIIEIFFDEICRYYEQNIGMEAKQ